MEFTLVDNGKCVCMSVGIHDYFYFILLCGAFNKLSLSVKQKIFDN